MTTKLPHQLAELIPPFLHDKAEAAYLDGAARYCIDIFERITLAATEKMLVDLKENIASQVSVFLLGAALETDDAVAVPPPRSQASHHIAPGEVGLFHRSRVEAFRAHYPNGENELRAMIGAFPPNHRMTADEYNAIKDRFGGGARNMRVPCMMRELGCVSDPSGRWVTPSSSIRQADARLFESNGTSRKEQRAGAACPPAAK